MSLMSDEQYREVVQQLDALVQEFESLPYPQIRDRALILLQTIDALHREPLTRLIALLQESGQEALVERAQEEPVIRTLLLLYDLAPEEELDRMGTGGSFIPVGEIGSVPDVIPLAEIGEGPAQPQPGPQFRTLAPAESVPPGTTRAFEVDGRQILIANVDGAFYAVSATCPGSAAPLHLGHFSPPILLCPWHNEAFDVRSGKRADGSEGDNLAVFPVKVVEGEIQLVVAFAPAPNKRSHP